MNCLNYIVLTCTYQWQTYAQTQNNLNLGTLKIFEMFYTSLINDMKICYRQHNTLLVNAESLNSGISKLDVIKIHTLNLYFHTGCARFHILNL